MIFDPEIDIIDIASVLPGNAAVENGTQSVTVNIIDDDASPNVTAFTINKIRSSMPRLRKFGSVLLYAF